MIDREILPYPDELREGVINSIKDLFLRGATPRAFADNLSEFASFIFKDDGRPESYRATAELFFSNMANRKILAFDVHDLVHHPLQLSVWPGQFEFIARAAQLAHTQANTSATSQRLQKLTQLTWLASFEESLILQDEVLISFGCLNWLAPSETPLDNIPDITKLPIDQQRTAYRWHYLDALKDMYRIQFENSKQLGVELNWLERLGYGVDERFMQLCRSSHERPLENLAFSDATTFKIRAPSSPLELFDNSMQLIKDEFNDAAIE